MTRPTYRIPARDVVPGMNSFGAAVTRAWRESGIVCWDTADGSQLAMAPTEATPIQLPGPSPRELLCACFMLQLHGGWHVEHEPTEHADDCPVSPNADRSRGPVHGGLRLWPVGGKFNRYGDSHGPAWTITGCCMGESFWGTVRKDWLVDPQAVPRDIGNPGYWTELGYWDQVLAAFYHPPTQPQAKPLPTPWDPEYS